MTRSTRKRTEMVTVEELLRRAGATPRKIGPAVPRDPVTGLAPGAFTGEPNERSAARARVEERVRAAADGWSKPGRAGARARRLAVTSGTAVVLGGLLALALVPEDVPCAPASLPAAPLPPATAASIAEGTAVPTSIQAMAVIMSAQPSPKRVATPESPRHPAPPATSASEAPATTTPAGYPGHPYYPGYPYYGYPYPPYGGPRP
ncbi:hypothetical protein [Amycolatopsis sp. NPDC051371]|uniref:hypothetical protein n=1 Tax=Amycolatopsis sp. NPDC051371 TaxID=3155800 RepID=UPI00341F6475